MIKVNLLKNRGTQTSSTTQADFQTNFDTSFESTAMGGSSSSAEGNPLVKLFIILGIPALLYAYESYNIQDLRNRSNIASQKALAMRKEVTENQSSAEIAKKLQKEIQDIEDRLNSIKQISKIRLREIRIIDYIQNVIPDRIWLQSMDMKDGKAKIIGATLSNEQLTKFIESLEEKNYFRNVILLRSVEQKQQGGTVQVFELSAEMVDPE